MTTTLSVRCQHCGAPLSLSEGIPFVTCNFCKTELEVVRDADVTHTRVFRELASQTQDISDRLAVIEIQNEIDRLDREWDRWQEHTVHRKEDGTLDFPSPVNALMTVIIGFVVITGCLSQISNLDHFRIVGVAGPFVVIVIALLQHLQYRRFDKAKTLFHNNRANLLRKLEAARKA
ncbi:MAG: hypothetical protein ACOYOF_03235 [Verrucomicrobiaceae bacterium]